jgi:hypothetical protein
MATNDETAHDLVEDPVLRMRSRFWRTSDDGVEVLHIETWVAGRRSHAAHPPGDGGAI